MILSTTTTTPRPPTRSKLSSSVPSSSSSLSSSRYKKIFGQDVALWSALWSNVVSWWVHTYAPGYLPRLLPHCDQEWIMMVGDEISTPTNTASTTTAFLTTASTTPTATTTTTTLTRCVSIGRPGGLEQLRLVQLKPGLATCGYNVPDQHVPFTQQLDEDPNDHHDNNIPSDCVLIRNEAFSVNYADVCIRWGLYKSAHDFVGYPIVPGFDVAGIIERVGGTADDDDDDATTSSSDFQVGDAVFGCSLFGSYSTRVLVPALQLRPIPAGWTPSQAAAMPTVALTSLYALYLAGLYHPCCYNTNDNNSGSRHHPSIDQQKKSGKTKSRTAATAVAATTTTSISRTSNNRAILIHSAAGGVGSVMATMSRLLGLHPIVGVVGHASKVDAALAAGCHIVIDKSSKTNKEKGWIHEARAAALPNQGYAAVMEASGVETFQDSYNLLAMTGRLIVYGFHTNLPIGQSHLSPWQWIRMAWKSRRMVLLDPMEMGSSNKGVLAFNLSFFAQERDLLTVLFDQVVEWMESGQLPCPRMVEMDMSDIAAAHELISTGKTVGKIVINTSR